MKQMKTILINYKGDLELPEQVVTEWRNTYSEVEFIEYRGKDIPPEALNKVNGFIGNPTNDMLDLMPGLEWVQLQGAGANLYASNSHLSDNVILTNCSGVFGVPGAEQVLALMLAFTRQIHVHVKQQMDHVWKKSERCLEILDSNVCVLGLGDIGSEVAKRAKGLGANVIAVKRSVTTKPAYVDEVYTLDQLNETLERCDFVINTLPLTPLTEGIISKQALEHMKQGAIFINVGRGDTVDEQALIESLKCGHLGGVGLDVTYKEPLPQESPLWDMPNVIITSHSVNTSPRKLERRLRILSENLDRYLNGQPLTNIVNRKLE